MDADDRLAVREEIKKRKSTATATQTRFKADTSRSKRAISRTPFKRPTNK